MDQHFFLPVMAFGCVSFVYPIVLQFYENGNVLVVNARGSGFKFSKEFLTSWCKHFLFIHLLEQTMGRRHLEYLQLFEKEMMMNYLRQRKAEEMSGIEMTVNKLQKRYAYIGISFIIKVLSILSAPFVCKTVGKVGFLKALWCTLTRNKRSVSIIKSD